MRTLHVELPRELSHSLKPWRHDLHEALARRRLTSEQVDLNPHFWSWVLRRSGADLRGRLSDIRFGDGTSHRRLVRELGEVTRGIQIPCGELSPGGLQIDRAIVQNSHNIAAWVESEVIGDAFEAWWYELDDEFRLTSNWDLVTFGVGSLNQLAFAAWLSARIRSGRTEVHTCLAYHQWENFSLSERLRRLCTEGALLDLFDSVVIHQEQAGAAIEGLNDALAEGNPDGLRNLAFTLDGERQFATDAAEYSRTIDFTTGTGLSNYIAASGLSPNQILYLDSIVRNDCYYGKCTFCVQNNGYIRRQNYKYEPELTRIMMLVEHLVRVDHVTAFSFVDQAVAPLLLERLAHAMTEKNLRANWCVRMLAEDLDDALLQSVASAGCREILFGVESANVATLERLGKRTQVAGADSLHRLVDKLRSHAIDATLSFIAGIPHESPLQFTETTQRFIEEAHVRHDHLTLILNRFALFAGSPMEQRPEMHGIEEVLRKNTDLELVLDYRDGQWSRKGEEAAPVNLVSLALGLEEGIEDPIFAADLTQVHYSSIGLLHRWRTGRWLTSEILNASPREQSRQYPGRTDVIFGATGYLGHNLALRLPASLLVLTSTSRPTPARVSAPHLVQDLRYGNSALLELTPSTAWIAARPVDVSFDEAASFNAHLQSVLRIWIETGSLKRIILFSSQLVMATPRPGEFASGEFPLAPECDYGCNLAQMEVFVSAMARAKSLSVDVVRLPLLWGGAMLPRHERTQLISSWCAGLNQGRRWHIHSDEDLLFGNSWVDVDDMIDALRVDSGPGLRVRTVKSGDFRYAELQKGLGPAISPEPLHLHRTSFFVEDQIGVPERLLRLGLHCPEIAAHPPDREPAYSTGRRPY